MDRPVRQEKYPTDKQIQDMLEASEKDGALGILRQIKKESESSSNSEDSMKQSKGLSAESALSSPKNSLVSEERRLQDLRYLKEVIEEEEKQKSQVAK